MLTESMARHLTTIMQWIALGASVSAQILLVGLVAMKRQSWRYTVLPGGYLLHVTFFYIYNFFIREDLRLNVFITFWSSLLRVHGVAVVILMAILMGYYVYCKLK